jgi:hypothetical protein
MPLDPRKKYLVANRRTSCGGELDTILYKLDKPENLSVHSDTETGDYTVTRTRRGTNNTSDIPSAFQVPLWSNTTFHIVDMNKDDNIQIRDKDFDVAVSADGYEVKPMYYHPPSTGGWQGSGAASNMSKEKSKSRK